MADGLHDMSWEGAILRSLAECGLSRDAVPMAWDPELDTYTIVIKRDASVLTEQFACIHEAARGTNVTFEDQSLDAAYADFAQDADHAFWLAVATERATKLGLLDGFPRRSDYPDLKTYAEALERHCGLPEGSVLRVAGDRVYFDPPREKDPGSATQRYERMFAATEYAGAIGDLKSFLVIGEEASSNAPEQ